MTEPSFSEGSSFVRARVRLDATGRPPGAAQSAVRQVVIDIEMRLTRVSGAGSH